MYRIECMKKQFNIELSQQSYEYMQNRIVINKAIIAQCMKNEGFVTSKGEAIKEYIDKIPEKNFSVFPKSIIDKVHLAGGKVFLAHPFGEKNKQMYMNDEFVKYIEGLIEVGLDGMECYYSTYNNEQIKYLLDIAKKNNLLVSCGSDYHGIKSKLGKLGIVTLEPYKILKDDLTILNLFE